MTQSNINIEFINTSNKLRTLTSSLLTKSEFAFDTEFDRFWREYGFKLLLIQIYDGATCYLIDPLAISDLSPLWQLFENNEICKIAYSCSEDIQLLKLNGCNTKNIFDVQVAAKICNHPGNSFGDLVLDICKTTLDKSLQRSNWRIRPLSSDQQIYASNDVIWLPQLKNHFNTIADAQNLNEILITENLACENISVTPYEVKLSSKQESRYNEYHKQKLYDLLILRDKIASKHNMPPFMICNDTLLEKCIEEPTVFLSNPFDKGFSSKLKNDTNFSTEYINIISSIDNTIEPLKRKKEKMVDSERKNIYAIKNMESDIKWKAVHAHITEKYGTISGEYIIRGLKKALQTRPYSEIILKPYQREIIDKTCNLLNITL